MELWNEGEEQQKEIVDLVFSWLENAFDVPIEEQTWQRTLFVLPMLPMDRPEHGNVETGVKLLTGKSGAKHWPSGLCRGNTRTIGMVDGGTARSRI